MGGGLVGAWELRLRLLITRSSEPFRS